MFDRKQKKFAVDKQFGWMHFERPDSQNKQMRKIKAKLSKIRITSKHTWKHGQNLTVKQVLGMMKGSSIRVYTQRSSKRFDPFGNNTSLARIFLKGDLLCSFSMFIILFLGSTRIDLHASLFQKPFIFLLLYRSEQRTSGQEC